MKALALVGLLLTTPAAAQVGINQGGGGSGGGGLSPALTSGHIFVGNASNVATDVALSGDATLANTGAITVTKTNGVAFGTMATQNANAVAITGGTITGTTVGGNTITAGTGTLTLGSSTITAGASGTLAILGSNTFTGAQVISGAGLTLSGAISAPAWTTNGIRYANVTSILTDTTSSGTVANAYTDVFGGNTIAASSAATFTNYYAMYVKAPVAGTNVTFTNKSAFGADSISIGGAAQGGNTLAILAGGNTFGVDGALSTTGSFAGNNYTLSFKQSAGNVNEVSVEGSNGGAIKISNTGSYKFSSTGDSLGTPDTFLTRPAAATIQFGAADAAVAIAQTTRVQNVVAGTAAANGANWTMIGSLPTGTGTSGDIIFQTGVKTGSGTTQGTPTTAFTLKGETQNAVFAAQLVAANMTQTSSAQSGTLCWAAGGLTYDATLGCLTSDERLKTNIAPLKGATQTIMALRPMTYDWSPQAPRFGNDPGNHIGMGAFATAYADERLIARGEDGQPRGWRTDAMISLTVAVTQDHERRLLALEARH